MPSHNPLTRRAAVLAPAALASLGATTANATSGPQASFDAYRDLINRQDFGLLEQSVMGEHPVFVFAGKRHDGLEATRAAFRQTWMVLPDEIYTMTAERWLFVDADHAGCTFIYSYRGTMADGRALSGGGQGVNIFEHTSKGWRLIFEQLTPDTQKATL